MPPACSRRAAGARRGLELADVVQRYGEEYRRTHWLTPQQHKVLNAIEACRTARLGGHLEYCQECGFERIAYNSCRNRHCPKCQSLARAEWLADRQAELLPVPYFHLVFTVPHELNGLMRANDRALFGLLFRSVSRTLLQFGHNNLGGQPGFTLILHTWDQKLRFHVHLHCVMAGGALSQDHQRWTSCSARFLFSVHALGRVFRGKFLDGLRQLRRNGKLLLPPPADDCSRDFAALLRSLRQKAWVVYAKPPFGGPDRVLDYLARYTHRIAISNERLLRIDDNGVTFAYRDRQHGDARRTVTLEGLEFMRRFLRHVLPRGFVRIRHYGLLASRSKTTTLARCRELLHVPSPIPPSDETTAEKILRLLDIDIARCPRCGRSPLIRIDLEPSSDQPSSDRQARPPPPA